MSLNDILNLLALLLTVATISFNLGRLFEFYKRN